MKKIGFSKRFGFTEMVKSGEKTMTRRLEPEFGGYAYEIGEQVALAEAYMDIPELRDLEGDPRLATAGWGNKLYVCAGLMPWRVTIASRRRERLREISEEDCLREGVFPLGDGFSYNDSMRRVGARCVFPTARDAFADMIDHVLGPGTWSGNPVTTVYGFEVSRVGN